MANAILTCMPLAKTCHMTSSKPMPTGKEKMGREEINNYELIIQSTILLFQKIISKTNFHTAKENRYS